MNDIHRDRGITTGQQYDRWQAARKSKAEREQTPVQRVVRHPVTFIVAVYVILAILALAVLDWIGALQPFLGKQ